jgi:hypothetical protein
VRKIDAFAHMSAEPIDYFRRFFADTAMFGAGHAVAAAAAIIAGNARRLLRLPA